MRTVLAIAYHFPPIGGAGVQRTTKFVRYLSEHGYASIVVTSPGPSWWTQADDRLMGEVPSSTEVIRAASPEPDPRGRWQERAVRWLGTRTAFDRWWTEEVVRTARSLVAAADVVYVSMPPFASGRAAAQIALPGGKPLVLDLRDPWAIDELTVYPTRLHRRRDARRMRAVLASASAIVMNTDEARRRLLECFPELADRPVVTIPNGYDEADFAAAPPPPRNDGSFRIVHTGLFLSDLGRRHVRTSLARRLLGGASADLQILTRSPVYLFEALDRIAAEQPSLAATLELNLAGALSESDRELADRCSVRVVAPGYLAHADAVALLRSADLLFLPMHTPPPGSRSASMPGKTYEYLASERPILAAVPDGDARDLLERAGGALLVRPADAAGMARLIVDEAARAREGRATGPPDPAVVAAYERRRLTAQLASLFDTVLGVGAQTAEPTAPAR